MASITNVTRYGDAPVWDDVPPSLPPTSNATPDPQIPAGFSFGTPAITLGNTGVTIDAATNNQQSSVVNNTTNVNTVKDQYSSKRLIPTNFDMTQGSSAIILQQGTVVEFNYAASSQSWIRVRFDYPDAPVIKMLLGQSYSGIPFRALYIDWDTDAAATAGNLAQLVITNDTIFDRVQTQG